MAFTVDKYAVCIGINQYADPDANLSGCVNDALDWAGLLTSQGYEVVTLIDGQATRSGVLDALRAAVEKMGYRDRLVITFSGHGSWVPDLNGDESDGRDEVLVTQELSYISDDDLEDIFVEKPFGSRIIFVSDSCHSGSVNRFTNGMQASHPGRRFLPPTYLTLNPSQGQRLESRNFPSIPRTFIGSRASLLLSGCADPEYSYDAWFNGRPNGAFSRVALDTFDPSITYRDWHRRIREVLPNAQYPQTPQMASTYHQSKWTALA